MRVAAAAMMISLESAAAFAARPMTTPRTLSNLRMQVTAVKDVEEEPLVRFAIGDRVECKVGADEWKVGKVVRLNYVGSAGRLVPYQVELEEGRRVYAPRDDDAVIRASGIAAKLRAAKLSAGGIPEAELQASFYAFDADGGGSIDREELEKALVQLGFGLPTEEVDRLFSKYAPNDEMSYNDFKSFIIETGIKPDPNMKFAMDLFTKYDADGGGSIVRAAGPELRSLAATWPQRVLACCSPAEAVTSAGCRISSSSKSWHSKSRPTTSGAPSSLVAPRHSGRFSSRDVGAA